MCTEFGRVEIEKSETDVHVLYVCGFVQLDNPDEQAAQIRRELDGRLQMADQIAKVRWCGDGDWGEGLSSTLEAKL